MSDFNTDLIDATIGNRTAEMNRQMNIGLYGDNCPPPARMQRIKRRIALYRNRVSDAWLVLMGEAHIE